LPSHLQKELLMLGAPQNLNLVTGISRGIEKESLRITPDGLLAQTPHAASLGSALTHPSITTDYSEALMEFITPVSQSIDRSIGMLEDVHSFVYQNLEDEILWSASMPCIMAGDDSISVAQYGSSNVARMKTAYRYGLGHRYGRLMQAIAGIHYNFSMPRAYWDLAWNSAGQPGDISDYINTRYLGLIRNFQHYSWLLVYLYGASPAVCSSFLQGQDNHGLQAFDDQSRSMHAPFGTSLRMGDMGYNSNAQKGMNICYNSLDDYIETLRRAILQPHPDYGAISCGKNGDYQQLSDSLLQIENEFYSPIRPKRVAYSGETPLSALRRNGIEYIEVRCIDVNPFLPVGLDAGQIRFMDTFLLFCLLDSNKACTEQDQATQRSNLEAIVNRGRQPGLMLTTDSGEQAFTDVANTLLDSMQDVAILLDRAFECEDYTHALSDQKAKIEDPELTPSARILREMRDKNLPFFRLAMAYSQRWADHFHSRQLDPASQARFDHERQDSLQRQIDLEQSDSISFEQYLKNFFEQYQSL
jgi:glutamate--cysteine ligase